MMQPIRISVIGHEKAVDIQTNKEAYIVSLVMLY